MSLKGEVAPCREEVDGRTGNFAFESLASAVGKNGIALSPHRQEARFVRP